jgi:hypothetical protein
MKKSLLLFILITVFVQSGYSQFWYELGSTPGTSLVSLFRVNSNNQISGNGDINAIVTDSIGNVYAAGGFLDVNGSNFVAQWNGTKWIEVGGTTPGFLQNIFEEIYALALDHKGNLYAAGEGTDASGNLFVSKWDGVSWTELGTNGINIKDSIIGNVAIKTLTTDPTGNVYAAGQLYDGNGNSYVAKWNGTSWIELGGTVPGVGLNGFTIYNTGNQINAISSDKYGNIYAGGNFTDSASRILLEPLQLTSTGMSMHQVALEVPGVLM